MTQTLVLPDGSVTCVGGSVILRPPIQWYGVVAGQSYEIVNIVSTGNGTYSVILRIGYGTRCARLDDILTGMC